MAISIASRESYHPRVDDKGRFVGGERDYSARLRLIESVIDFSGKRVLDLGCSGGFFTFSIANKAKSVTAVDADKHMIEKNRETASKLDYKNIEFIHERITPDFISSLPKYDVVLFLSVFHHMMASSGTYDWTENYQQAEVKRNLTAIKGLGDILVFEMGRPDEGFHWCGEVKNIVGEPRDWIPEHIFGDGYRKVQILPGTAYEKWPFSMLPQLSRFGAGTRVGRKARNLLGVDQRDFREICVGWK